MKAKPHSLFIVLTLLAVVHQAAAQGAQFFRISGPAATTITSLNQDGTLVWSNALAGTNYTVQTALFLPAGTNWVDYVQLPVTQAVNTNLIVAFDPPAGMALIPAGSFTMGNYIIIGSSITNDPDITDAIPTNVYLSAFYMDVNLITSNQWQVVYNWATNNGYDFDNAGSGKATNHPVQQVNWYDAVKWCNARSQTEGLTPVYYTDEGLTQVFHSNTNLTGVYTNGAGQALVYVNWTNSGYRLPTEAEWEKAARGGLSGQRFPWGDTISENLANYVGNTNVYSYDLGPNGYNAAFTNGLPPYTSPVDFFPPNGYGLYDMAGNVWQWCWDWYAGSPYPTGSPYLGGADPHGPTFSTYGARVFRGGSWGFEDADFSRCAHRSYIYPVSATAAVLGFRCVKELRFSSPNET